MNWHTYLNEIQLITPAKLLQAQLMMFDHVPVEYLMWKWNYERVPIVLIFYNLLVFIDSTSITNNKYL